MVEVYAGRVEFFGELSTPSGRLAVRNVDDSLEVRRPLDFTGDQSTNSVSAKSAYKETQLEHHILPRPSKWFFSLQRAGIIGRHEDNRVCDPRSNLLEFRDQTTAAIRLLVKDHRLKTKPLYEAGDFVQSGGVSTVDYEDARTLRGCADQGCAAPLSN